MQEEVENRTLNLAISTTKLSGRALLAAFRKYMQHRRNVKAKKLAVENEKPVGEQTIDQLLGQNQGATNIEIEKTDIKGFKRFLDKYGIDYNPASPPYHMGDTVYLDNQEYRITELRENTVQLLPNGVAYPVFRAESRERFEGLLRQDSRNGAVTEYLAPNPSNVDQDLLEVLATGLLSAQDRMSILSLVFGR